MQASKLVQTPCPLQILHFTVKNQFRSLHRLQFPPFKVENQFIAPSHVWTRLHRRFSEMFICSKSCGGPLRKYHRNLYILVLRISSMDGRDARISRMNFYTLLYLWSQIYLPDLTLSSLLSFELHITPFTGRSVYYVYMLIQFFSKLLDQSIVRDTRGLHAHAQCLTTSELLSMRCTTQKCPCSKKQRISSTTTQLNEVKISIRPPATTKSVVISANSIYLLSTCFPFIVCVFVIGT